MLIRVLQKHINYGEVGDGSFCPIALAIRDAVPNVTYISVGEWSVVINNRIYDLPEEAADFIDDFDAGCDVEPFEFEF